MHSSICIDNRIAFLKCCCFCRADPCGLVPRTPRAWPHAVESVYVRAGLNFAPHIDGSPLSSPSLHSVSRLRFVSMGTSFNVRFICISEAHKERALLTIHLPQGLRQVPESRQDRATTDQRLSAINWQRKVYILQCLSEDDFFASNPQFNKAPLWHEF